ncbi:carbohydrate-binding protein [Allorhizocola rhizosphaerae]|uniref:carbohydrate-binding protein n=1 Tax=Allorhizocola rhizosphaerae TaxID=1872709 RepID=UPI000E3DB43E|nr:carbohydrate-binding protein [Allorhizocola rhizosphaerae]
MRLQRLIACATVLAGAVVVSSATVAVAAPTRYEAETSPATCDGTIDTNHAGYSGSGFCNANNAVGAALQFTVNASAAGTATLGIRFANGTTTARPADVLVNGTSVQSASFEGTGAWTTWVTKSLSVSVNAGSNTIRLSPTAADGLPNVDYLDFEVGGGTGGCGSGSFNAEVTQSGSTYTARNGSRTVYTGTSYLSAINGAIGSLTAGRTSQEKVVVRAGGSIGASTVGVPSNTSLEVCGTMNVGNRSGRGAVETVNARNVSIPYLTMTGNPYFGIRVYGMNNLHLGQITMQLSGGLGIRFERDLAANSNVRMDNIFVSGAGSHAVETWNVDGLTVGTVTARNVGESALLLQTTTNAQVGLVDGQNVATGTGYGVFRLANRAGRVGSSYPTNIRVGEVRASGGGRGIFCVSESGGVVIDRITITNTGNNSILLENCYNVTIAAVSGTVSGGGEVRIAARSEFPPSRDISLRNLTVSNTNIRWSPCQGTNNTITNVTRVNSTLYWC